MLVKAVSLRLIKVQGDEVCSYGCASRSDYQEKVRNGSIALFNHRSRSHTAKFLEKISVITEGGRNNDLPDEVRFADNYYSQAYARLCRHGLANTITTSFSNPGSGRFIHYLDLRAITVREAARLQSFPDTFIFDGDLTTQMRHVGNAVPPLLANAIRDKVADDIREFLATEEGTVKRSSPRSPESAELRLQMMRSVPSQNTAAELMLRNALTSNGVRGYRIHHSNAPGSPDIAFTRF